MICISFQSIVLLAKKDVLFVFYGLICIGWDAGILEKKVDYKGVELQYLGHYLKIDGIACRQICKPKFGRHLFIFVKITGWNLKVFFVCSTGFY